MIAPNLETDVGRDYITGKEEIKCQLELYGLNSNQDFNWADSVLGLFRSEGYFREEVKIRGIYNEFNDPSTGRPILIRKT